MTKQDTCKADNYLTGKTFDYALPQPWLDRIAEVTGKYLPSGFVWLYDAQAPLFGRPYPITDEGAKLLILYQETSKYDL